MPLLASFPPAATASPTLQGRELAPLPEPVGLKGRYAGLRDGHLIPAGGSNFPVPPREGGRKTLHRTVYVRARPFSEKERWRTIVDGLPRGMGEGAAVTIEDGVTGLGGHDGVQPVATALVLRWDQVAGKGVAGPLPSLPAAGAHGAAVFTPGRIYVAGGESAAGPLGTLWRLDAGRTPVEPAAARWQARPPPPGRPRFVGIVVAVTTPAGERPLYGGGLPGPAKSPYDYWHGMWLFDPVGETWSPAAPLPRGAMLAASLRLDTTRVLVLGGSDGHDFARSEELGERHRIPSDGLVCDAPADRWATNGAMPQGGGGAAVVRKGEEWVVAGGEYSPGLRNTAVYAMRVGAR